MAMSALTAAEILALARMMDRAALAIQLGMPGLCPVALLRLLEQELVMRAADASVEEILAVRAAS